MQRFFPLSQRRHRLRSSDPLSTVPTAARPRHTEVWRGCGGRAREGKGGGEAAKGGSGDREQNEVKPSESYREKFWSAGAINKGL